MAANRQALLVAQARGDVISLARRQRAGVVEQMPQAAAVVLGAETAFSAVQPGGGFGVGPANAEDFPCGGFAPGYGLSIPVLLRQLDGLPKERHRFVPAPHQLFHFGQLHNDLHLFGGGEQRQQAPVVVDGDFVGVGRLRRFTGVTQVVAALLLVF